MWLMTNVFLDEFWHHGDKKKNGVKYTKVFSKKRSKIVIFWRKNVLNHHYI
jgi:hypothetical protein